MGGEFGPGDPVRDGRSAVTAVNSRCGDCGQDAVKVHLYNSSGGVWILLDPEAVIIGGELDKWNNRRREKLLG